MFKGITAAALFACLIASPATAITFNLSGTGRTTAQVPEAVSFFLSLNLNENATRAVQGASTVFTDIVTGGQLQVTNIDTGEFEREIFGGTFTTFSLNETRVDAFGPGQSLRLSLRGNDTTTGASFAHFLDLQGTNIVPSVRTFLGEVLDLPLFVNNLVDAINQNQVNRGVQTLFSPTFGSTLFTGNDNFRPIQLTGASVDVSAVPLPAAAPLFATGLIALAFLRRNRKRSTV